LRVTPSLRRLGGSKEQGATRLSPLSGAMITAKVKNKARRLLVPTGYLQQKADQNSAGRVLSWLA
jgi:hypothetical protein